jgi:hypothetical protein
MEDVKGKLSKAEMVEVEMMWSSQGREPSEIIGRSNIMRDI